MIVTFLSTSDIHGYIDPTDFTKRGQDTAPFSLSRAARVIRDYKKHARPDEFVIVVENGDFIQGSPLTNFVAKNPDDYAGIYQNFADTVNYDVRILGNHEFNYGVEYLNQTILSRTDKVLAANVNKVKSDYKIFEKNDVKVAVIGLTTSYIPHWEDADNLKDWVFEDEYLVAKKLVNELRLQVDVVAIAYHGGFERDLDTGQPTENIDQKENQGYAISQIEGLDVLITGHQHRLLAKTQISGKQIGVTQPGFRGEAVGLISLDLSNKELTAQLIETAPFDPNDKVLNIARPVMDPMDDYLDEVVGELSENVLIEDPLRARLHNHPYLELVNKIQMSAVDTEISSTQLFKDEIHGFNKQVTRRQIATNFPYPNYIVAQELTGAELLADLELNATYFVLDGDRLVVNQDYIYPKLANYRYDVYSGIDYRLDFSKPFGQRLVKAEYKGKPIDDHRKYLIAVSDYRAGGSDGHSSFSSDKTVRKNETIIYEYVENYIRENSVVKIAKPTNINSKGYLWL